ncbi:rubrerythrin family protein [Halomarina ordinaria]|uniref:Rubrerythrin family protein n=1 Tax=Halomarina ordinaria TaxID=3033939 RepID=A0ABD5U9J5_9EURY|nr:rubrerythrin family protein [Halomarina sp. PSRA2]
MDPDTFVSTVRAECATELDRLGSEKALVATTAAHLDREHVLTAAARAERRAATTFETWAEREDEAAAREAFERVADRERQHAARVEDHLDGEVEATADALHEHLRGCDSTVERAAAGMVGRSLVTDRTFLQTINFFVNESDEAAANLFRELRSETDEQVEDGAALLDDLCGRDEDWERAREAAVAVVELAYEEYADALEGMGIDPRPVC